MLLRNFHVVYVCVIQDGRKIELRVRETKFIVVLLFNNYDIIFHVNNCKAAFAPSCVSVPVLSPSVFLYPMFQVIPIFSHFVSFPFLL